MTTDYNSHILQQYADELYRRVKWIVFWTAVKYGLGVAVVSLVSVSLVNLQKQIDSSSANSILTVVVILTLVGVVAGIDAGRRKAFGLKVQAQELLCKRQIELNTRAAATSPRSGQSVTENAPSV